MSLNLIGFTNFFHKVCYISKCIPTFAIDIVSDEKNILNHFLIVFLIWL